MASSVSAQKFPILRKLSIGVGPDAGRILFADIISRILINRGRENVPAVNLIAQPASQLQRMLSLGEIDLTLTSEGTIDREIRAVEEFELPMGMFISAQYKDVVDGKSSDELISQDQIPLVLPAPSSVIRTSIDMYLNRQRLKANCVFESNMNSVVRRAAIRGIGATIFPRPCFIDEVRDGLIMEIPLQESWSHRITLFADADHPPKDHEDFIQSICEELKKVCH